MTAGKALTLHGRRRALGAGLVVCLLASPDAVSAQSLASVARASTEARTAGGAESTVREYLAAVRTRDWNNVARLLHPSALAEFRELMRPLLESADPKAAEVRTVLTGTDSVTGITAMPDAAFFSAVMSRIFALMPPELANAVFEASHTVIGSVAESADTTHVVCRARVTVSGVSATMMEVITARRTSDGWAPMLDGAFASALRDLAHGPK